MTTIIADQALNTHVIERHRADSIQVDRRVQRDIIPAHVRKIAADFKPDGIGVIHVSRRDDDGLYVMDGQHRILALIELGLGATLLDCAVYDDLTLADEARMYRVLNNSRISGVWEDFKVGLIEGDSEWTSIVKIADRVGLRVRQQGGDGMVSCIAAMRSVWRTGESGPAALGFALSVAVNAWGSRSDSVDGHLVAGLGRMYARYGEDIDRPTLIRKLSKYRGGAPGLLGAGKQLKGIRGGSIGSQVTALCVDVYNSGRRGDNQLPPL